MAERRMFAKTIIDSDAFIDMPLSTQALYFHLSMRGDDDGFINNPKKIQRMIGASDDDLKMLVAKRFIIPFESGIVVIKHWKIHNYIRGDRKKQTVYPEEMSLLVEKDNGAYTLKTEAPMPIEPPIIEPPAEETARQKAYRESSLPYSFEYKIRQAFRGEICPVCGFAMSENVDECGIASDNRKPTIQHNKPISKGGRHELGNISVICHQCNVSLQDTETGRLNADEVIKKWDEIGMAGKCQASVRQVSGNSRHRLGKDSIGKDSLGECECREMPAAPATTPTLEDVIQYCTTKGYTFAEKFYYYYQSVNWLDKNGKPIDWKAKADYWKLSDDAKKSTGVRYSNYDPNDAMNRAVERSSSDQPRTAGEDEEIRKRAEELRASLEKRGEAV